MTKKVVFMVEELSMKHLLDVLVPRLYPGLDFVCVPHDGKKDLAASLPRKLRGWREPGVQFVVLQDQDLADCRKAKWALASICSRAGRPDAVVRIVCQELEAWYFGEWAAVERAYGMPAASLSSKASHARFRVPDAVPKPSNAMKEILRPFQKGTGARLIGQHLSRENSSQSFRAFLQGIDRLISPANTDPR